jgi:acetyltransferase-like isoleucine patch superfamily enzyme
MTAFVADSADVDHRSSIGAGAKIWHLAQVREDAVVGANCVIGRAAYVGTGVILGDNCKIQNGAQLYEPAVLEAGVFVGPGAIFTNDQHPRAVTASGDLKSANEWDAVGVTCREGASIGAGAICIAPVTIGRWAMVAAGAVVATDVPDFALVAGVPARRIGWVGHAGVRLRATGGEGWTCPASGGTYVERNGQLWEHP